MTSRRSSWMRRPSRGGDGRRSGACPRLRRRKTQRRREARRPAPGSPGAVVALRDASGELDKELYAAFHVLEVHDLARRVHVAQGYAHQPRRDSSAPHLDRPRVRARWARVALDLERDLELLGGLHEALVDLGVDVRAPAEDRARAELGLAVLAVVAVGMVGR